MGCDYCKNEVENVPIVNSGNRLEGVYSTIERSKDGAYLSTRFWYDALVDSSVDSEINYCPMCGERLVE